LENTMSRPNFTPSDFDKGLTRLGFCEPRRFAF
jgi:hypothetical protein